MHLKLPSVKCTCVLCLTTCPYTLSTNWPVQHKLGLIRKENTSPKCQTSPEMSICPRLQRQTAVTSGPQSGWRAHGSPEAVSDSLSRNYLVVQTNCCISCLGGLVSDCLAGEEAGCGDPGLGYTWSGGFETVGMSIRAVAHQPGQLYVPSKPVALCCGTCATIMRFNQHLCMAHLSGGWWIILAGLSAR